MKIMALSKNKSYKAEKQNNIAKSEGVTKMATSKYVLEQINQTKEKDLQSISIINSKNPYSIKEIHVQLLFGYYSYTLPEKEVENDYSKLLILYGDNGSGKTTILKCIFYLLSTKDNAGYKTQLARVKFQKFCVKFENGLEIGAYRTDVLIGSYFFYISDKKNLNYELFLDSEGYDYSITLQKDSGKQLQLRKMFKYIDDLNIVSYYLSDDRKLLNNFKDDNSRREEMISRDILLRNSVIHNGIIQISQDDQTDINLTIEKLAEWVRRKVIDASNTGEINSLNIYTELVRNISSINTITKSNASKVELLETFKSISAKSKEYVDLGLINEYEYKQLTELIYQLQSPDKIELVYKIIKPFLNSIQGRLEALKELKDLLVKFIMSLNSYFSNKVLNFNINEGLSIEHVKGDYIDFKDLSSGEKQLLTLLINAITATDDASIFIIDEPEISLNIKWQRTLLKTLQELSKFSKVQFIIATHSIELLASSLQNVIKVEE